MSAFQIFVLYGLPILIMIGGYAYAAHARRIARQKHAHGAE
ncbi:MAG TPA: hypothetical protein VKY22_15570 [Bradyrhizobium sp.]|nr:hypothetical protein [Bradyrhizobium sp.]